MSYSVDLPLSPAWTVEQDQYEEVDGAIITHLECHLPDKEGVDQVFLDLYVGDMPADTTAEDEAYANYAEIVGWDESEDEEESPIAEWRFRRKSAYGFSGECEDGSLMLLMCVEILKGALLIATVIAPDETGLGKWSRYIEEKLSVKAVK